MLRKAINIRLYSIQKLFQLPIAVKIQFLKTFILPYFDYCATFCIYFSNTILQKLANTYNNCIFKLLNNSEIRTTIVNTSDDFNKWNKIQFKWVSTSLGNQIMYIYSKNFLLFK